MSTLSRAGIFGACFAACTAFGCGVAAPIERVTSQGEALLGTDITLSGTAAFGDAPTHDALGTAGPLSVIYDGTFEPQGSTDAAQQWNAYTGKTETENWISYTYATAQSFGAVVYQQGIQYWNGGWFTSVAVQVEQSGVWTTVSDVTASPAFGGDNGVNFQAYTFTFPAVTGTAIRVYGAPGGLNTYTTTGQMRIYAAAGSSDAGADSAADASSDASTDAARDAGSDASDGSGDANDATVADASDASVSDASDAGAGSDATDGALSDANDATPSSDASDSGTADALAEAEASSGDEGETESGVDATADAAPDAAPDTGGVAAYVRQWAAFQCDGNCPPEGNSNNEAIYATLSPVLAGSTVVVFVTEADNGDATTPPVTMSDSAGDSYAELGNVNDQPDQQATLLLVTTNVAATGSALKVTSAFDGVNQWQGIVVMEVAGTGPLSVVASTSNLIFNDCCGSPGSLPDDLPSMTLTAPSLVIAMTNGFDVMTAGSGYTALGSAWDWMGAEGACNCNSATLEYGTFPVGIAAPTFTPIEPITNWMNLAVAIESH
jgi:hypothetical protein